MVWIEIPAGFGLTCKQYVTTFAVVWIEIILHMPVLPPNIVTTFAVVWIEILSGGIIVRPFSGHHLRGGVD